MANPAVRGKSTFRADSQVGMAAMDPALTRIDAAAKSVRSSSRSSILAFRAASDPDETTRSSDTSSRVSTEALVFSSWALPNTANSGHLFPNTEERRAGIPLPRTENCRRYSDDGVSIDLFY